MEQIKTGLEESGFSHRFSLLCDRSGAPKGKGRYRYLSELLEVSPRSLAAWDSGQSEPRISTLEKVVDILLKNIREPLNHADVTEWLRSGYGDLGDKLGDKGIGISLSHEELLTIYLSTASFATEAGIADIQIEFNAATKEKLFDKIISFTKTEIANGRHDFLYSPDFKTFVTAAIWLAQKEMI